MRSTRDRSPSPGSSTWPTIARLLLAPALALALAAAVTTTASADGGGPGSTVPEQPGDNNATGCAAVIAHSGTGLTNASPTAVGIATALLADACSGG